MCNVNAPDDERVAEAVEVEEVEQRNARAGDRNDGKFPVDARSLAMRDGPFPVDARSLAMRNVRVEHVDKKNDED